jgi:hypothetical protein
VDLRHQRSGHEARLVEELVVRPLRVFLRKPVGDCVVLVGEERVQKCEAEPEVARDAGQVDLGVEVARELAVRIEAEPAAASLPKRRRDGRLAPVDLRAVPPV